jgi:hypothetical protein
MGNACNISGHKFFFIIRILHKNVEIKRKVVSFDVGLLGFDTVWTCRKILTFLRNMLPPYSAVRMKTSQLKTSSLP